MTEKVVDVLASCLGCRGKYVGLEAHGVGDVRKVRFAAAPDLFFIANDVCTTDEVVGQVESARSSFIEEQPQNTWILFVRNDHEFQDPKALCRPAANEEGTNKVEGVTTKALFEDNTALFQEGKVQ